MEKALTEDEILTYENSDAEGEVLRLEDRIAKVKEVLDRCGYKLRRKLEENDKLLAMLRSPEEDIPF